MPAIPAKAQPCNALRARRPWRWAALFALAPRPSGAQHGVGPAPEAAKELRYVSGWYCNTECQLPGRVCVPLDMPAGAFPTGNSYGRGKACDHGFRVVRGVGREAFAFAENAFLDDFRPSWDFDRGDRKQSDGCTLIAVPEDAHLADRRLGLSRGGNRGRVILASVCIPAAIPGEAFATNRPLATPCAVSRASSRPAVVARWLPFPTTPFSTTIRMVPVRSEIVGARLARRAAKPLTGSRRQISTALTVSGKVNGLSCCPRLAYVS